MTIAEALDAFREAWVEEQPFTPRTAYERTLRLLAFQLERDGLSADADLDRLTPRPPGRLRGLARRHGDGRRRGRHPQGRAPRRAAGGVPRRHATAAATSTWDASACGSCPIVRPGPKVPRAAVDHQRVDVAAAIMSQRAGAAGVEAGAALLRKALDQQVATSAQLLEVLPQPTPAPSLEMHLGRSLDLYA